MKPKPGSKFFNRYLLLAVILLVGFGPLGVLAQAKKSKITVFGSSVAGGAVAQNNRGYWYMLKDILRYRGFDVSSCSRSGDRTTRILDRFPDLLTHEADYVFIGLSLDNEGIRKKDQAGASLPPNISDCLI